MTTSTVFNNNRTQAIRLPVEMRFPDSVKKVAIRVAGQERIIAPAELAWDSFFLSAETVPDNFMAERASQSQTAREDLNAESGVYHPTLSHLQP
jgi:antitoxin VapB